MRPTPFRRMLLASAIVLGVSALAVPAEAAISILNDPKGDVVTYDDDGTPMDVPRADVIGANADYRWDEIYFSLAVAEGADPRTDPNWAGGASVAGWVLDTNLTLNKPIVGMAPTPTGGGYWLVASDGGIFTFGDAAFHGSTGDIKLNQPIVGMAPSKTGNGYWFVARDGGVFNFGDAAFHGSATGGGLSPVVGMAAARDGKGYTIARANGQVTYRGSAIPDPTPGQSGPHPGSVTGPLNHPIVGIAATV